MFNIVKLVKNCKNCQKIVIAKSMSKIENLPCNYVFCDDETYTWGTSCFNTQLDEYYRPRNTYGISKFL